MIKYISSTCLNYYFLIKYMCGSFQNINLFSFGHLIKDGELLIKVSDQPPKKRYVNLVKEDMYLNKTLFSPLCRWKQ